MHVKFPFAAALALLAGSVSPGRADPVVATAPPAMSGEGSGEALKTLKEKLSDKASDEQRVDNCRVPADRRGTKPRPDCPPRRTTSRRLDND